MPTLNCSCCERVIDPKEVLLTLGRATVFSGSIGVPFYICPDCAKAKLNIDTSKTYVTHEK